MNRTERDTGVGAAGGALAGAAVAGPVGAVVGGVGGGIAGNQFAKKTDSDDASRTATYSSTYPNGSGYSSAQGYSANAGNSSSAGTSGSSGYRSGTTASAQSGSTNRSTAGGGTSTASNDRGTIRSMQHALNDRGYDSGKADGIMGPHTESALTKFQQNNGLRATGRLDSETIAALGIGSPGTVVGSHNGSRPSGTPDDARATDRMASSSQPSTPAPRGGASTQDGSQMGGSSSASGNASGDTSPSAATSSSAQGGATQ